MRELILITLVGRDQPAVTSTITDILAQSGATVLDIGQAVIHENLSLGILVQVPNSENSSEVIKNILFRAHALDMQVKFQPIDEASYTEWVGMQGKPKHIVSLLARKIEAAHIAELTSIIAEFGLNIDNINRLSGRVPLDQASGPSPKTQACVEFSARGYVADITQLRSALAELASRFDIDIAFQEDNMYRRTRRLVCFDMDSTLIEAEVIDELAKAAGVGEQVAQITESAMRGDIDFNQSFRQRVKLLKGLDERVLEEIAQALPITEGAERLTSTLKKLGYKTAILSGGFSYFGKYLQNKLDIDYVYANELDINEGRVTGEVTSPIVDGLRKAELLKQLAQKEKIRLEQVVAVGDGANDLPMLSIAGLGIAFRAKPLVKAEAEQSISHLGLDAILYLMGYRDREISSAGT